MGVYLSAGHGDGAGHDAHLLALLHDQMHVRLHRKGGGCQRLRCQQNTMTDLNYSVFFTQLFHF